MLTATTATDFTNANCVDVDPQLMQPEVASAEDIEVAKSTCGGCALFDACRELAESQVGGAYGVHAGKWYGHKPAPVLFCHWCRGPLSAARSTNRFCNDTCRKRAARAAAAAA